MCTTEGNTGTISATGTTPHTATTGCSLLRQALVESRHDVDHSEKICMVQLMLPGGSCLICTIWQLFPGWDLYCRYTDYSRHLITPDTQRQDPTVEDHVHITRYDLDELCDLDDLRDLNCDLNCDLCEVWKVVSAMIMSLPSSLITLVPHYPRPSSPSSLITLVPRRADRGSARVGDSGGQGGD